MSPEVTAAKEAALAASGAEGRATAYAAWQRVAQREGPICADRPARPVLRDHLLGGLNHPKRLVDR